MSEALHFAEDKLQIIALSFMAVVYIVKIRWILSHKAGKERQAPSSGGKEVPSVAIIYSLANIAMPWTMESTRKNPLFYAQFVLFHLGVTAAIILSFIIPYGAGLLESNLIVLIFQIFTGAAFVVGILRIIRRLTNKYIKAISTPDDYFSLILLTVWFFFAFWSVPNNYQQGETILLTYFWLTAFFLVYVPFSKISHYLYYPFTRYYLGKTMGRRGVYPMKKPVKPQTATN